MYGSLADARLGADSILDCRTTSPTGAGEGDAVNLTGLVNNFTNLHGHSLANLVASGHLHFSGNSSNTVISYDSNGSAALGFMGTLVTLVGVAFTTEGAAVLNFADNLVA